MVCKNNDCMKHIALGFCDRSGYSYQGGEIIQALNILIIADGQEK